LREKISFVVFIICFFIGLQTSFAAEVYYLGTGGSGADFQDSYPSYTLKQRISDITKLSKDISNPEVSGGLSGTFTQEVTWQNVGGNKSKSFLTKGEDYRSELNLNLFQKLWSNYRFEGQSFLRKTDDRLVESERGLRMKSINMRVLNDRNMFEFGDFYGELSPFTLGRSLEGFNAQVESANRSKYRFIAARANRPDEAESVFQRQVFGVKTDQFLFKDSDIFSNFRLGIQAATFQDDSATVKNKSSAKDLSNTVVSIDSEVSLVKNFSLGFELARSAYLEDEDALDKDRSYGTALRIQPQMNLGRSSLRYLYYYVQPDFQTTGGSALPDKEQHQLNWDFRISERMFFSLVHNYYWDHLSKSSKTKRTTYSEQYTTLRFKPSERRQRLEARVYFNRMDVNSDDRENSAEAITNTFGLNINDVLGEKTNIGFNYEYRDFGNRANKSLSNYYHRIGLNLGREESLFNRRLYYSVSPSADIRSAKTDENKDTHLSLSFNGQYDVTKKLISRFAYNARSMDNSKPDSDFWNFQSYFEFDYALMPELGRRLALRLERNQYRYEDGGQNYNETRAITRFSTNF